MKITRTDRGARIVQGGAVLSEVLAAPGPTHSVFDVLAAGIAALAPGPRVAVLGFAGGGLVAPLRALGAEHRVEAVDLDTTGPDLFRELCGEWAGEVTIDKGDAVAWLKGRHGCYDAIVEDLSELGDEGETKPLVSVTALPARIHRRLSRRGIAILNLLPVPRASWRSLTSQAAAPYPAAQIVQLDDFENRVVIAGTELPPPRKTSKLLREALERLGSSTALRFRLRKYGR